MRLLLITTLVPALAFSTPVTRFANDALGIRNAAARAATNAQPDDDSATVRSGTSAGAVVRVLLSVALIASEAGLLALEPAQPQQPDLVSPVEFGREYSAEARSLQPTHGYTDRWLDEPLRTNYTDGVADGAALVRARLVDDDDPVAGAGRSGRGGSLSPRGARCRCRAWR